MADFILDAVTRHQIFVQRYAAGREVEAVRALNRIIAEVDARLAGEVTDWSRARLTGIILDLRAQNRAIIADFGQDLTDEMLEFAQYEAEFNQKVLQSTVSIPLGIPSPGQIASAVYTSIMPVEPKKGYTIRDALHMFADRKAEQIVQIIQDGVILGDTRQQIMAKLNDQFGMQKDQARTLARTVVNHVSNQARAKTMEANADILDGYEWVSVLDSRTSFICMSRDGIVYPITEDPIKSPKPPAHFSCRSTTVPKVKPEYNLASKVIGRRPSVGAEGGKQVAGNVTYQSWLAGQPKSFQDEVLGRHRAELFRSGGLKLNAFVNEFGETYSLSRLRQLEPLAFERAGL